MIDGLISAIATWAGTGPVDGGTARILACAGATRPSLAPAHVRGSVDVALLVGAAVGGVGDVRRRIEQRAPILTAPAAVIDALDPLLCDVDPAWAWHLARAHAIDAGAGGALDAEALDAELRALAAALAEHADPGDEARDGAPILSALTICGHATEVVALAARWRCPPPLFASVVFAEADPATAAAMIELDAIGQLASACYRSAWTASTSPHVLGSRRLAPFGRFG